MTTIDELVEQLVRANFEGADYVTRASSRAAVLAAYDEAAGSGRPCTCHPDDKPPVPCPKKYALTECRDAAAGREGQPVCSGCHDTGRVPSLTGLLGGIPCPDCRPAPKADQEQIVGWQSCGDCDPCIGGRPDQCAVGRIPIGPEPEAVAEADWVCSGCGETVQPQDVTFAERHDPRHGGCGGECSVPLAASPARGGEGEKAAEKMEDALEQIRQWAQAYPLTVFPEPDFAKAHELLKAGGMTLDAISASNMRHVITQVQKIVDAAMSREAQDT